MTAAELVADLEARGVILEPEPDGRLAVEPASLLTPEELEELRRAKPAVLRLLAARSVARRVFPWPATLAGAPRVVSLLDHCARCPDDAHPARRSTWASYGGRPLCMHHALEAEAQEVRPS